MSALRIVVKTDNTGISAGNQFVLPLRPGYSYNATIQPEGLSSLQQTNDVSPTITWGLAGTYYIDIIENVSGGFPGIYFNNGGDRLKLLELANWGTNQFLFLDGAFYGCANFDITATDHLTANTSSITSLTRVCRDCTSLTKFPLINTENINVSFHAWYNCINLNNFALIDMSKVSNFTAAWYSCYNLVSFPFINTSNGTAFTSAFQNCTGINNYDFPTINLSKMTSGLNMFVGVTLSTQSWTDLLINTNSVNSNTGVNWNGGSSLYYNSAQSARDNLTNVKSWSISDGGNAGPDPTTGYKNQLLNPMYLGKTNLMGSLA